VNILIKIFVRLKDTLLRKVEERYFSHKNFESLRHYIVQLTGGQEQSVVSWLLHP